MADTEYAASDELLPPFSRLNTPTFGELQRNQGNGGFANLGAAIGSAIGGGGLRDMRYQQIAQQAATGSARTADILLQANQRRDAEIGRRAAAKEFFDKGDTASGNAVLNAKDSHEAAQALSEIARQKAIAGIAGQLGEVGYTPQMAALGGGMVGASGGTNTLNDVKALLTAGIPLAGTPGVGLSKAQLAAGINPNSTKVAGGVYFDENEPVTQAQVQTPEGMSAVRENDAQAARARGGAVIDKASNYEIKDLGNGTYVRINKLTGEQTPVTGPGGAAVAPTNLGDDLTGEDYAKTLPPVDAQAARMLVKGLQPAPTGRSAYSGAGAKALYNASRIDSTFDANRSKVRTEFETGGPNAPVSVLQAGSTAIQHLSQLVDKAKRLDNFSGLSVANLPANVARNVYLTATQDPRLTGFNSVRDKLVEEMTRFYRGVGGAEADIQREIQGLASSSSYPQLVEAANTQADLMASRLKTYQSRWKQTMGAASEDFPVLSFDATKDLEHIRQAGSKKKPNTNLGSNPTAAQAPAKAAPTAVEPEGATKVVGGVTYTVRDGHWDDGR